jgi:hypothetical protein
MFNRPPPIGYDPLREFLGTCEVKTLRDGQVVSLGRPAPTVWGPETRVIGISTPRDVEAFVAPGILRHARKGIVWVTNSWEAGCRLLAALREAGVRVEAAA